MRKSFLSCEANASPLPLLLKHDDIHDIMACTTDEKIKFDFGKLKIISSDERKFLIIFCNIKKGREAKIERKSCTSRYDKLL
jgi:hypothetical protein